MSKIISTLLLSCLISTITAQNCYFGTWVCNSSNTLTQTGFSPDATQFPAFINGEAANATISFLNFDSLTIGGQRVGVNALRIDTISNLPSGLCWSTGSEGIVFNGGESGCILISGTTCAAPGQYKLHISVHVFSNSSTPAHTDGDSIGLKYFVTVDNQGQTAVAVDTTQTAANAFIAYGNAASCAANLSVAIGLNQTVCTGANVELNAIVANGQAPYSYSWSSTGNSLSCLSCGSTAATVTQTSTFTVTVTDHNNATATTSVTYSISPNPIPITASGPTSFCAGYQVLKLFAGGGYQQQDYYWTLHSGYNWSNQGTSSNITAYTSGTYIVTATDGRGCNFADSIVVSINTPVPNYQIAADGPTGFCGSTVVLDAGSGYVSYAWSNTSSANTITVTQPGDYSVTAVGTDGCNYTNNVNLAFTTLQITPSGPTSFCAGYQVLTLAATSGFSTYSWALHAGNSWNSVGSSSGVTAQASGEYIVTATNQQGCIYSDSVPVTINTPVPNYQIVADGPTGFCGSTVVLDAGSGYLSYAWSNTSSANTITVTHPGDYSVTAVGTDGCNYTNNVNLAFTTLQITPSGPTSYCAGYQVLTLGATSGFSAYSWTLHAGNNWNSVGSTSVVTAQASGEYIATTTNQQGCIYSDSLPVTINTPVPNYQIVADGPTGFCGSTVVLDAGSSYVSYAWSNTSSANTITVTQPGDYSVTAVGTDGCNYTNNVNLAFTTLQITPSGPTSYCAGYQVLTLGATSGFSAYSWTLHAGNNWNSVGSTSVVTALASGEYIATTTNQQGCIYSDSLPVTINTPVPNYQIVADGPTGFCGSTVVLDAGSGYVSYAWSNTTSSNTITVTQPGDYSVTAVGTDGCDYTNNVNLAFTTLQITPSGPTSYCAGYQVLTLGATSGFSTYSWTLHAGNNWNSVGLSSVDTARASGVYIVTTTNQQDCIYSDSVPVSINTPVPNYQIVADAPNGLCHDTVILDAGSGYVSYAWSNNATSNTITVTQNGDYRVTALGTDGCNYEAQLNFQFDTLSIIPSGATTFCIGQQSLTLNTSPPFNAYAWTLNGINIPNTGTLQEITAQDSGLYAVAVTNLNGCHQSDSVLVTANTPLSGYQIQPGGPIAFCNDTVTLDAGAGFMSYAWSNGASSETIAVHESATYTVTVSAASLCTYTDSISINANQTYNDQSICIVTVDETSGKNVVVWQKANGSIGQIDSFNVYRETAIANVYELMTTQLYDSFSIYQDTASNPAQNSNTYVITAVNTCGESPYSNPHQTIHLSSNLGVNNVVNLQWNAYVGFSYPTFSIYRGTLQSNLSLLAQVPSGTLSYTDLTPPAPPLYYQIEVVNPNGCTPKSTDYSSSRSNINQIVPSSIANNTADAFSLYCFYNESTGENVLHIKCDAVSKCELKLVDLAGRDIFSVGSLTSNEVVIPKSTAKGIYIVDAVYEGNNSRIKILVK